MFDLNSTERLAAWKQFRDSLETSRDPLLDVAEFWSRAPFVSSFLDPNNSSTWPDPWHLVIDCKLDSLAICLGMLYTLKLTQRFIDTPCEIHILPNDKDPTFFLVVDKQRVLNFEYKAVVDITVVNDLPTSIIWSKTQL